MPDGVIGNTSDSGSEESRFDPWSGRIMRRHRTMVSSGGSQSPDGSSILPGAIILIPIFVDFSTTHFYNN